MIVAVTAVLAPSAVGARPGPKALVLQASDVPAGYAFDADNSMAYPRGADFGGAAEIGRVLRRTGFAGGYVVRYTNTGPPRWRYINSAAFLFERPGGAERFLSWLDASLRKQRGVRLLRRAVDLGQRGWLYTSGSADVGTAVQWRHGRVVAIVTCQQMTRHRPLALGHAAKQERRIAAALG